MDRAQKTEPTSIGKFGLAWLFGLLLILILSGIIGWFDNSTELTPYHENVDQICFVSAGLAGILSAGVAIWQSVGMSIWRRATGAFVFALIGVLSVLLILSSVADIVIGVIDFPPGKTRSYRGLLLISRAYQTHGKGRSWNIQTTPIWSNLDITEDDYNFMLAHRRVGDDPSDPDEISSQGYFCAEVTIEQAGEALRVMHAGSHKLPKGTVIICPWERPA